jgi:hypothetical protein
MEGWRLGPIHMADGSHPCGELDSVLRAWEPCIDGKTVLSAQLLDTRGTTAFGGLRNTVHQTSTVLTLSSSAILSTNSSQLRVTQVREI